MLYIIVYYDFFFWVKRSISFIVFPVVHTIRKSYNTLALPKSVSNYQEQVDELKD